MNSRRKGSTLGIVIGVLAVLLVGGGIYYWVSDPGRTRMNEAWKQGTKWTPEQIAKDPVMYLNYVEAEANSALEKLKASKIAIAQNKGNLEKMRDDAKHSIDVGKKAVTELVAAYKAAPSDAKTISWNNKDMDVNIVKTQVVSLDKEVQTKQILLKKVQSGLDNLDVQSAKIIKAEADAKAQIAEIQTNRELLKVQGITDDLKNKFDTMQVAVASVVTTATDTGSNSVVSLDQLAAQSEVKADNADFDKVLTNYAK
ncbi:MAG TPA: hypothetical protein VK968_14070 [Roseimicrobium sp.]|nr:hypothetical protein [Roseimicrobium sp.]